MTLELFINVMIISLILDYVNAGWLIVNQHSIFIYLCIAGSCTERRIYI